MRLGFAKVGGLVLRRRSATPYISVTPSGRGDAQSVLTIDGFAHGYLEPQNK